MTMTFKKLDGTEHVFTDEQEWLVNQLGDDQNHITLVPATFFGRPVAVLACILEVAPGVHTLAPAALLLDQPFLNTYGPYLFGPNGDALVNRETDEKIVSDDEDLRTIDEGLAVVTDDRFTAAIRRLRESGRIH